VTRCAAGAAARPAAGVRQITRAQTSSANSATRFAPSLPAHPHPQALAAIEAALQSKWWGLRIIAIQTLERAGSDPAV